MKIYPFKIPKQLNENLVVQVDQGESFYNRLHQHEEIQIAYIVKGQGKLVIADSIHPYRPGDIFVIGGNSPHLFKSIEQGEGMSHMISIFFTEQSFGQYFLEINELESVHRFFNKARVGFKPLTKNASMERIMRKLPENDKFSRFILFLKLLKKLCNCETKELTNFIYSKQMSNHDGQRMQIVFDYVIHNFQNEITLKKVAELIHMTPNAFCRYFKQRTNKTFFKYLIELRIEHACQLLKNNPDISIAQISDRSGFKSISNFNRKFKELKQVSPSFYLNKMEVVMTG
ncbi:AraC family transcriptional regulator [Flavobacteriaceae bacterium F89]|uniref:AraC family transcriptional regulator n=1 Tax=Cerina litoralis TaxID=2874477 RepID=A0AAE3EXZ1_9FLAO|nr:AraC family transcriptional regulator [Cerina litoralis]MCG2462189.1 AraC family transcriptional regulator [Cerina litoralis]